jgi:hypothetical protein
LAPKPTSPKIANAAKLSAALRATLRRSRTRSGASNRNASTSPAVTLMPTPTTSVAAAVRKRGLAPAVNASAAASRNISTVSLCAPPTASSSTTGFRPTNAAAQAGELPSRPAARAISATAPRLERTAIALNAHSPAAIPSGAVA